MGMYVAESKYTVNASIANNTNHYLKNEHCSWSPCNTNSISFYCYSNMTGTVITMNYPKKTVRYYDSWSGFHRYREVDPWQRQYQPIHSGLHMSVLQDDISDVAVGTYICEERISHYSSQSQIMAFGVYRYDSKEYISLGIC